MSMDGLTLAEWAELHGSSDRNARRWLKAGMLDGAVKVGREWRIPRDTMPPATRPAHMRPAGRVIQGELIEAGHESVRPAGLAVVTPEAPLVTPEAPLPAVPALCRPYVTLDELAAICAGEPRRKALAAMLAAGEIPGGVKRGGDNGQGWLVPAAEVKRLIGGQW